jgi:hypothetical protein
MPVGGAGLSAAGSSGGSWMSNFDWSKMGDIASSVGGIVDSIFGGGGSDEANDLAKEQLEFMMDMARAGQRDTLGNRVYFDKKTNSWVVDPNQTNRAIQVASDEEERRRLQHDLPIQRGELDRASEGRGEDSLIADTLRRRILGQRDISKQELEGLMYDANARGIKETTDSLGSQFATQGLRTGISPQRSLDQLAKTQSRELGNASVDARLAALTGADEINQRRTAGNIDAYGAMSDRANNTNNVPFNPASLSAGLGAIAANKQGALGAVNSASRNAIATSSVPSSTYGRIGTAAGSVFDIFGDIAKGNKKDPTVGNTSY